MENKEKLKAKLRKKREARKNGNNSSDIFSGETGIFSGETDILKMMDQVNKLLKTNPQMVQQISKCVSNVMNNQGLMESLSGQLEKQIQEDQTFESKELDESKDASSNESIQ